MSIYDLWNIQHDKQAKIIDSDVYENYVMSKQDILARLEDRNRYILDRQGLDKTINKAAGEIARKVFSQIQACMK